MPRARPARRPDRGAPADARDGGRVVGRARPGRDGARRLRATARGRRAAGRRARRLRTGGCARTAPRACACAAPPGSPRCATRRASTPIATHATGRSRRSRSRPRARGSGGGMIVTLLRDLLIGFNYGMLGYFVVLNVIYTVLLVLGWRAISTVRPPPPADRLRRDRPLAADDADLDDRPGLQRGPGDRRLGARAARRALPDARGRRRQRRLDRRHARTR